MMNATEEQNLPYDVFAKACPSRGTLEHVTGRWGALTLGALQEGSLRFNELRRRVDGVSEKMLSQTLQALERDGLVHREAQPTNPPRVDYELTPWATRSPSACCRSSTAWRAAWTPYWRLANATTPRAGPSDTSDRSSWTGSSRDGGASASHTACRAVPRVRTRRASGRSTPIRH